MRVLTLVVFMNISYVYGALEPGHCEPDIYSKKYIQNDYQQGWPRTVEFTCEYKCNTGTSVISLIGTTSSLITNERDEAHNTTCQGVQVNRVSYGYNFDEVKSFYIHDSVTPELKDYAYERLGFNFKIERKKLMELKADLKQVIQGYTVAGESGTVYAPSFVRASVVLQEIEKELPLMTKSLDKYLAEIVLRGGVVGNIGEDQDMALTVLKSLAKWRLPYLEN